MHKMICTIKGYAIIDGGSSTLCEFNIKTGRPIYMKAKSFCLAEVASIYLLGVVDTVQILVPKSDDESEDTPDAKDIVR